uniref:leucine-rich repeat transmembrane neuronal protein 3-like n=1 Tax=Myxine glutinosa TaxID=7769 RepID=UPI00358E6221
MWATLAGASPRCPNGCRCAGRMVYCEAQQLSGMPVGIGRGTQGLSLRYNSLKAIGDGQFSRLRRLTWLYIDHNFVQTISPGAFSGVHRLRELILGSNRIGDLDASTFRQLPNIRNLDLSYNHLEHLAPGLFSGLRKLQSLQLRANAIRSLPNRPFRDCRALEFLDLGYNRLRALPRTSFTGLKHLTELHVERNRVVRVDVIRLGPRLPNLRALYLKLNRIDMLSHIPPPRWTSLQVLDLSGNGLQQLKPEIMERLPNLEELKLDSNKLEVLEPDVFTSLPSLVFLSLTGNPWACDERLCGLAAWLHSFKGQHGGRMLCAGPEQLAGNNVLEALESYNLCQEHDTVLPKPHSRSPTLIPYNHSNMIEGTLEGEEAGVPPFLDVVAIASTIAVSSSSPPSPEHDLEQMSLQKVVAGCAALILSVLVILLVVFISWRRYPASVRHLQASTSGGAPLPLPLSRHGRSGNARRRNRHRGGKKRHGFGGSGEAAGTGVQTTSQAAIIPLEYYVDYKTTNADVAEIPLATVSSPDVFDPLPCYPPPNSGRNHCTRGGLPLGPSVTTGSDGEAARFQEGARPVLVIEESLDFATQRRDTCICIESNGDGGQTS